MRRIYITLLTVFSFCWPALSQQTQALLPDSIDSAKITVSRTTTTPQGAQTTEVTVSSADDSVYTATYTDVPAGNDSATNNEEFDSDEQSLSFSFFNNPFSSQIASQSAVMLTFIVFFFIFGFPLLIIFIAFYFRYRSRKARYKLVEQALASGQPIPEGLFKEKTKLNTRSKGIKNICTGIGLFIFLWAITGSFGVGAIGLLIMFTGIGQYIESHNQPPTDENK